MATVQQDKIVELGILSIQKLRGCVSRNFQHLEDGVTNPQEDEEKMKVFITRLQENLSSINDAMK